MRLTWIAAACILGILFVSSTPSMERVMHAAPSTTVQVTVTARTIHVTPRTVPAGDVVLTIANIGLVPDAVVITGPLAAGSACRTLARRRVSPGQTATLILPLLAPGQYRIACPDDAPGPLRRECILCVTAR